MDPIERQDAIDIAKELTITFDGYEMNNQAVANYCVEIMRLSPVQPEFVRCKDCKNSEHWYRDRRRCFLWSEDGVSVFDDGFCSYAERKE